MSEWRMDADRDPVYAVAADWLSRLQQRRLTLEETLAWQDWMSQEPRHRQAFAELEELWEKFDSVPVPDPVSPQALRADTYDGSVPVSHWVAQPRTVPLRNGRRLALAAMLLIALTSLGVGSLFAPSIVTNSGEGRTYATAVGQNENIRLADGSSVQLGGSTRLRVMMGPRLRQIDLLAGEACFDVAQDRTRPFSVRAGSATVTAVGTEFNVRRSDDRVVVSVIEGRVLVQPMSSVVPISWLPATVALGSAAPLSAGQRTTLNRRGLESTQTVSDASSAVAWQHGRLAFESEPLRYVVQDVNRYASKPIVLADARMGDIRVTGTVTETNIIGWINSLQAAFGIRAQIDADRIVLRPD